MIPFFKEFNQHIKGKSINIQNKKIKNLIEKFSFQQIFDNALFDQQILQKINESEIIVIDTYSFMDTEYIIVCFEKQLIIINQTFQKTIKAIFSRINEDKLYFVPKNQNDNKLLFGILNNIKPHFQINSSNNESIVKFWEIIQPCMATYLIQKGYSKSNKDCLENFTKKKSDKQKELKIFKEEEFIHLKAISPEIDLFYHIEMEELFIIKEIEQIQINNYKSLNFPFLPKLYGTIENKKLVVIEYINGQLLSNFDINRLSLNQKIRNIIEILSTCYYLFKNNFIYKNLCQNNLLLDSKQQIVFFNINCIIKIEDEHKQLLETDVYSKENSYDDSYVSNISIYQIIINFFGNSVGKLYVKMQSIPDLIIYFTKFYLEKSLGKYQKNIYYIELILEIINDLNSQYILSIIYYIKGDSNRYIHYLTLAANNNHPEAQNKLGLIYYDGEYIKRDISKAIHYYSLAANQNHPKAQLNLGFIYSIGEYIKRDIAKAIHYYSLAASQNYPEAQFIIGFIYFTGEYVPRDISKAIHYYSLAASQNIPQAQYSLGVIYYTGEYVPRDISKAIHYLTLAAKQNFPEAQHNLGVIYYTDEYVTRNIVKVIHYLTLASNQNIPQAQYSLGVIYYTGKYIKRDIVKAIHYYSLAANQNNQEAQYNLGFIYYTGEYVPRDINKSIHYLTLAANQNDPEAQFMFGIINYEGIYIKRNLKKSFHYFMNAAKQNHRIAQFIIGIFYLNANFLQKAITYLELSARNRFIEANFVLGVLFSKENNEMKDLNKSLYYYKVASSFDHSYSKNNIAIYYKNKNIQHSIFYLKEVVKRNDDLVSMYNLSQIYFYEYQHDKYNKITIFLVQSAHQFNPSKILLSIVLVSKYKAITFDIIKKEIIFVDQISDRKQIIQLARDVYQLIKMKNLEDSTCYDYEYEKYRHINYIYDYNYQIVLANSLIDKNECVYKKESKDIDYQFYDGAEIE